jgi:hypothetical protein
MTTLRFDSQAESRFLVSRRELYVSPRSSVIFVVNGETGTHARGFGKQFVPSSLKLFAILKAFQ